jgi:hypothetical protein
LATEAQASLHNGAAGYRKVEQKVIERRIGSNRPIVEEFLKSSPRQPAARSSFSGDRVPWASQRLGARLVLLNERDKLLERGMSAFAREAT